MKKKTLTLLLVILFFIISPLTALADMGPKPSVVIDFTGLEKETYYVTLLSFEKSYGPYSVFEKDNQRYEPTSEDYNIWQKFVQYRDKDNFYFLQYFSNCTNNHQFKWGYYPPNKFKILIYFPEKDSFVISESYYTTYAFDSYYSVDLGKLTIQANTNYTVAVTIKETYNYKLEIINIIARVISTIVIEMLIALLFGFRKKAQLISIVIVNIITQVILNASLNILAFNQGALAFMIIYLWIETMIFLIEAIAYYKLLNKYSVNPDKKKWLPIIYAFVANMVTFFLGIYLWFVIPTLF